MTTKNNYHDLLQILQHRFESNMNRHSNLNWDDILNKLNKNPEKLESLLQMEESGGEPDVVGLDEKSGEYLFYDCAAESPKGRRSFCYDKEALDKRKENKPKNNAVDAAKSMGIEILNEEEYRELQTLGTFDNKTSSWLKTPENIRKLGGAIFADFRFDTIFIYHNGAESYYAGRGFRGVLRV
ncbi:DUF4256 domain-containing protein [Kaistella flava (ex Peng et al. 2021)]|uniref:DUF4256 domain-containing protein n=1 Tax=Kaistella flava (ex Peng et al. 2021) TaxID=2038776 RepID=A0A7M2Y773_9FLAO|nr:DUF4256 domain-containing protein [Kaistella flava (ex Peng et al. 2021)]QOW09213.1 DUF4256 domain-containing protein [Kaistella flava (ex Peng et al. 2021)]